MLEKIFPYDPPSRPAWVVTLGVLFGVVSVGALIGFSAVYLGITSAPLIGFASGLFGCLVANQFGFPATLRASLLAGALGLSTYVISVLFAWTSGTWGMEVGLLEYMQAMADHGAGIVGFHITGRGMWSLWAIEAAVAAGFAAGIGWSVDISDQFESSDEAEAAPSESREAK